MVKDTTLIAVYDGINQVEIDCMLNTETKEVFNIEMPKFIDSFGCFQGFYINIDGVLMPVFQKNKVRDNEYWYKW